MRNTKKILWESLLKRDQKSLWESNRQKVTFSIESTQVQNRPRKNFRKKIAIHSLHRRTAGNFVLFFLQVDRIPAIIEHWDWRLGGSRVEYEICLFCGVYERKTNETPPSRSMGCQLLKNTEIGDCKKTVNREEQIDKQEEKKWDNY